MKHINRHVSRLDGCKQAVAMPFHYLINLALSAIREHIHIRIACTEAPARVMTCTHHSCHYDLEAIGSLCRIPVQQ